MRVVLCGYGRMGKMIEDTIRLHNDIEIAMIVDETNQDSLYLLQEPVDMIIDFSNPASFDVLHRYILEKKVALLSGTTNLSQEQLVQLQDLGKEVPILHCANFSLGIAVFQQLLQQITPVLEKDFDIEVIESHHNQKVDAPSGTAKLLVAAMNPNHSYEEVHGREGNCGARGNEIGIHAIRGGTVAGEHTVVFLGQDEILEIKHTATSRQIFVNGAIHAAKWLIKQQPGCYDMQDVVKKGE